MVCGGLLWLMRQPLERQREWLQSDWVADDGLAAFGIPLSPALLVGVFGISIALVAMRGLADSIWYGSLASTARGGKPGVFSFVSRSSLGFSILAMLRLGLTTGAVMFLSPFFRVIGRLLMSEGATVRTEWFAGISLACSLLGIAYIQFFVALASAHLVWRPRFLAGTIVSALAAPFRQWAIYGRLLPLWFASAALAWLAGALTVAGFMEAWETGNGTEVWTLFAAGAAATGFLGGAVWDALLVTIVGQRIGDIQPARRVLSARPEPAQSTSMQSAPDQTRFEPPVRGAYSTGSGSRLEPDSIVRFSDVVGTDPGVAEGWVSELAGQSKADGPTETIFGMLELVVDPGSVEPAVCWEDLTTAPATPAGLSWADGGVDSLNDLEPGRPVYAAAGGAPERVWRPVSADDAQ
jgi:hypothetical protein